MHNPFARLNKKEWILMSVSLVVVITANLLSGDIQFIHLTATILGAIALIFMAKGDIWSQVLIIIFCILYSIAAIQVSYWGELFTFGGLTLPLGVVALISWIRNPYEGDQEEVAIAKLTRRNIVMMTVLTIVVTIVFYFVLRAFDTPNLPVSTLSISTSFAAAYLTYLRSSWYAMAYATNDLVVVTLWILMSIHDKSNLPMVANFTMFFVNDIYGFISWKKREKKQEKGL